MERKTTENRDPKKIRNLYTEGAGTVYVLHLCNRIFFFTMLNRSVMELCALVVSYDLIAHLQILRSFEPAQKYGFFKKPPFRAGSSHGSNIEVIKIMGPKKNHAVFFKPCLYKKSFGTYSKFTHCLHDNLELLRLQPKHL